jgi:hypothetical protein
MTWYNEAPCQSWLSSLAPSHVKRLTLVRHAKSTFVRYISRRLTSEQRVIFLSACVEGILQLFTNFYLQRKFSIFLRNDCDCKVVDPYNHLPQDWPHGGIQRIGWLANQSRFVTKWLKRGCVHNLDLLVKDLSNNNPAKKAQTHKKINFWKYPILRFYKKHNLASKLFLFNKETQV